MTQYNNNRPPVRRPAQQGARVAPAARNAQSARPAARPAQQARPNTQQARAQSAHPAARSAQSRPAASQPKGRFGVGAVAIVAACLVVLVLGVLMQYFIMPGGFDLRTADTAAETSVAEIHASTTIRLSEIMSSNKSILPTNLGETPDWIEIRNDGNAPVDLNGWSLAKVANSTSAFTFPTHVLNPGEHLLVFADSQMRNTFGYAYHAPFSISAAGDTLMLFNSKGTAVDTVNIPALKKNQVYRRIGENWEISSEYTPGMENIYENYRTMIEATVVSDLVINEFMASNATYLGDGSGIFHDYIEIFNTGETEMDLSGWYLSDDRETPTKWRIPDGTTIPAKGYLVFFASGLDEGMHTNFRLSSEGEMAVLANNIGQPVQIVAYDLLKTDQAYSRLADGSFTTSLAPTPGLANTTESAALTERQFAAQNSIGVYLSEVMASTTELDYDWVEVVNRTNNVIDLSGFGLSDNASAPRKWQFPQGTTIQPGQYLCLYLSGLDGVTEGNVYHTNFKLSAAGGDTMTLSLPDGSIFDRMYLPEQLGNISYGRLENQNGFYFLETSTPMAKNETRGYPGRAEQATVSTHGGLFDNGETVTVTLSSQPGTTIYYTLDATVPTTASMPYTGPITISSTTVLRTRVFRDSFLPSLIDTETYFFGLDHDMRVVSLVTHPDDLFNEQTGLYMMGPNASSTSPYKGANFWSLREIEAHVELFGLDGETILSQGCAICMHGQYSRAMDQKAFKVIARRQYGDSRFRAPIFEDRDYTEYQSFLLRAGGQDGEMTHMRDSVLQTLVASSGVMYMETELCVLYINGQYWGQYNLRERVNPYSVSQFEGWEGQEDDVNLVKANTNVMQGSDETYQNMLSWVKRNGIPNDEALEAVGQVIDLDNYIAYHALQIFVGNSDTANVKRYMNPNADGKWRYIMFDLDWGFHTDTNSIRRWLTPGGMGVNKGTDNTLFIALMKNSTFRDRFLTYFGRMLATEWTTENIIGLFQERYEALEKELPRQMERWGQSKGNLDAHIQRLIEYCQTRPTKIIGYTKDALDLSNSQMEHYFGDAIAVISGS